MYPQMKDLFINVDYGHKLIDCSKKITYLQMCNKICEEVYFKHFHFFIFHLTMVVVFIEGMVG